MKTSFQAKLLQHLAKKNGNKGFTLIELLVVIIIVGVLAAIALPSMLNQVAKARNTEAKSNSGAINRAYQAYRLEKGTFVIPGTTITDLETQISWDKFKVSEPIETKYTATYTVTPKSDDDLYAYAAAVGQGGAKESSFVSQICESTDSLGKIDPDNLPGTNVTASATDAADKNDCTNGNEVGAQ